MLYSKMNTVECVNTLVKPLILCHLLANKFNMKVILSEFAYKPLLTYTWCFERLNV